MKHPALDDTKHRPWPLPQNSWSMRQAWCDLLFAHWPLPAASLRQLIPTSLQIQEFEGTAWIGVVPFRMEGVTPRGFPALPWLSAFPELNVRTYVEAEGKPGVWFFSLDAGNPVAVWAARKLFYLPYFRAHMKTGHTGQGFAYQSRRLSPSASPALFLATYRPTSAVYESKPGTLEHWLTERYCLYAQGPDQATYRGEVHHRPWPLQHAEADVSVNSMLDPLGLSLPNHPPVLHFARRLEVVVWSPERLAG